MRLSNINTKLLEEKLGTQSNKEKKGFRLIKWLKGTVMLGVFSTAVVVGAKKLGFGQTVVLGENESQIKTIYEQNQIGSEKDVASDSIQNQTSLKPIEQPDFGKTFVSNNTQIPEPTTPGDEEVVPEEEPIKILADTLNITGLVMHNKQITVEEREEELAKEQGTIPSSTVYESEDKTNWASKEDYEAAKDVGIADAEVGTEVVTIEKTDTDDKKVDTSYIDPEDSEKTVWSSEEESQEYKNADNIIEDDCYRDENGTLWISKEDAEAKEDDITGYVDADGVLWESEEKYKASLKIDENTASQNMYTASDGSVWPSEEDYINSVTKNDNNNEEQKVYDINEVYVDPEGNYWSSKEEYENHLKNEGQIETYSMDEEYDYTQDDSVKTR